MPRTRSQNQAQLALELERKTQQLPVIIGNPEGLLSALADLLLAALSVEAMSKENGDERQDHG